MILELLIWGLTLCDARSAIVAGGFRWATLRSKAVLPRLLLEMFIPDLIDLLLGREKSVSPLDHVLDGSSAQEDFIGPVEYVHHELLSFVGLHFCDLHVHLPEWLPLLLVELIEHFFVQDEIVFVPSTEEPLVLLF